MPNVDTADRKPIETYLGDAVYASFDGFHIWLRTGDGNNQRIALDPEVLSALVAYSLKLRGLPYAK